MSLQTSKKIEIKNKDDISNYYSQNINKENEINNFFPIKKIKIIKAKDINYKALTQKSNNSLQNLEILKNLPESIITNIIKSQQYISPNHNILFHHYSKVKKVKEKNKKNSIRIKNVIINYNLISKIKKEKNMIKIEPSNDAELKLVYHKKTIPKSNTNLNTNRKSKINDKINIHGTNYDYDNNDNFINFNNSYDKFNLFEKKNYFNDVSLKEYLFNEIKALRTASHYYGKKVKNKKPEENKNNNSFSGKQKNERNNIINTKIKEYKNKTEKYNFSKINNEIKEKNKSENNIISYMNKFKKEKNQTSLKIRNNNLVHKILTKISYDFLSSNGNFTSNNSKRKTFIQLKEKNKNNNKKYNVNFKNFYNDFKIDYISFRKNNLNDINKLSATKNKKISTFKEESKRPCKLIRKKLKMTPY